MSPPKKCKTCGYYEPAGALPGRGWCRYPKVDPAGIGYRKLERADELGCRDHRPLWWISKAEWKRWQTQGDMLFLLDE
jgi:hypothetical protein